MSANLESLFLLILQNGLNVLFNLLNAFLTEGNQFLRFRQPRRDLVQFERVLLKTFGDFLQALHGLFVGQFLFGHI